MGRKNKSVNRPLLPDTKYNSVVVSKFVCRMMLDGKKATATRIIYEALDELKAKTEKDPLEVFLKALDTVKPLVEVKYRRVCGATYQVTIEIREKGSLVGVYNKNKGYAEFKQIQILYQNEEYSIIKSNTEFGLIEYDYIVLEAETVNDDELLN